MAERDDGQDHGEHLPRHRHGHQQDGGKRRQGVDFFHLELASFIPKRGDGVDERRHTDKDLPNSTTRRKPEDISPDGRVFRQKRQCGRKLARRTGDIHAQPLTHARLDQPRRQDQVPSRQESSQQIVSTHHLRSRVPLERSEDVILGAIRQAVKKQVNPKQQQSPLRLSRRVLARLVLLARMQREYSDARRHRGNNEVLV